MSVLFFLTWDAKCERINWHDINLYNNVKGGGGWCWEPVIAWSYKQRAGTSWVLCWQRELNFATVGESVTLSTSGPIKLRIKTSHKFCHRPQQCFCVWYVWKRTEMKKRRQVFIICLYKSHCIYISLRGSLLQALQIHVLCLSVSLNLRKRYIHGICLPVRLNLRKRYRGMTYVCSWG